MLQLISANPRDFTRPELSLRWSDLGLLWYQQLLGRIMGTCWLKVPNILSHLMLVPSNHGATMFHMATVSHKRWDPCLLYRTSLKESVLGSFFSRIELQWILILLIQSIINRCDPYSEKITLLTENFVLKRGLQEYMFSKNWIHQLFKNIHFSKHIRKKVRK